MGFGAQPQPLESNVAIFTVYFQNNVFFGIFWSKFLLKEHARF